MFISLNQFAQKKRLNYAAARKMALNNELNIYRKTPRGQIFVDDKNPYKDESKNKPESCIVEPTENEIKNCKLEKNNPLYKLWYLAKLTLQVVELQSHIRKNVSAKQEDVEKAFQIKDYIKNITNQRV